MTYWPRRVRDYQGATMTTTLSDWLLAQIAEDEAVAREARPDADEHWLYDLDAKGGAEFRHIARHDPARVLAECEAKRRIVERHQSWPVLVQQPPEFEGGLVGDPNSVTLRMSQRMAWLTEQEYRAKFGDEPPTAPVLRLLALPYADRPGYREEWRP